jgi:hypothetical protein
VSPFIAHLPPGEVISQTAYVAKATSAANGNIFNAVAVYNQQANASTWSDQSGNNRHGTVVGATWNASGGPTAAMPGYFSFNGTSNYVTMGALAAFDFTTQMTLVWWERSDNSSSQISNAEKISKGNDTYRVKQSSGTANSAQWSFRTAIGSSSVGPDLTGVVTPNTWQMFMARKTATAMQLLRIDNSAVNQLGSVSSTAVIYTMPTEHFTVGARSTVNGTVFDRFFRFHVTGLSVYGTALTDAQFLELYAASSANSVESGGGGLPAYLSDPYYNPVVAFEGAMGYGANAVGGRTGTPSLIFVDNLNNSGTGSLRQALETSSGPRFVVPRVSGYVNLTSRIRIENSNVTFLGQLAPGSGLAVRPASLPHTLALLQIRNCNNVVIRYLRLRSGEVTFPFDDGDCLSIWGSISPVSDVILDHVSFSFATDETASTWANTSRVTVQNCLLTRPLSNAGHTEVTHDYGVLIGTSTNQQNSWLYNILSDARRRGPQFNASGKHQWMYNTVYNVSEPSVFGTDNDNDGPGLTGLVDWRRNTYIAGPRFPGGSTKAWRFRNTATSNSVRHKVYMEGNLAPLITDEFSVPNQWNAASVIDSVKSGLISEWESANPVGTPNVLEMTRAAAHNLVLTTAGHSLNRDSLDTTAVTQILNNTGRNGAYTSVSDAGGYPTLTSTAYPTASDGVIANSWRTAKGDNRAWNVIDGATGRLVLELYADDIAQGRFTP